MDLSTADSCSDESGSDVGETEFDASISEKKKKKGRRSAVTGRGITMQMLIDDDILDPGSKVLSIDYLRQKFEGDLLADGQISWNEHVFSSPSAWAMHCKKMVNPDKKSGCGWASVKYKGKKLDQFKSAWFTKQRLAHSIVTPKPSSYSPPPATMKQHVPAPEKKGRPVIKSPVAELSKVSSKKFQPSTVTSTLVSPNASVQQKVVRAKSPLISSKSLSGNSSASSVLHEGFGASDNEAAPLAAHKELGLQSSIKGPHLTFSEALQVVQNQSSTAVQSGSRMGQTHVTPSPAQLPQAQHYHSLSSGRVYRRKPGRPARETPKVASTMIPASVQAPLLSGRGRGRRGHRTRVSAKHSTVNIDSDPQTLVECCQFSTTGKIQPFSISMATSCLLLMDFHSHLCTNEVQGYLAGKWDSGQLHLQVLHCYPLKCRQGDRAVADQCEDKIRSTIESQGLLLVGCYHSHPFCQADPTVVDIKNQTAYQSVLRDDSDHEPCIGVIVSPFDSYKKETIVKAFWVQRAPEPDSTRLGLPLLMKFTTQQDQQLTQNLVNEMVSLVNFYKGCSDSVRFTEMWLGETTYLDKIKHSVIRKFPQDQTDGRFLDFIHKMLASVSGLPRLGVEDVI